MLTRSLVERPFAPPQYHAPGRRGGHETRRAAATAQGPTTPHCLAAYSSACLLTKRSPVYLHLLGVGSIGQSLIVCSGEPSAPPPVVATSPSTTIGGMLCVPSIGVGTPAS